MHQQRPFFSIQKIWWNKVHNFSTLNVIAQIKQDEPTSFGCISGNMLVWSSESKRIWWSIHNTQNHPNLAFKLCGESRKPWNWSCLADKCWCWCWAGGCCGWAEMAFPTSNPWIDERMRWQEWKSGESSHWDTWTRLAWLWQCGIDMECL